MRLVSWAVCLALVVFVVTTDRADLETLGTLTGAVLVLLGFEVRLPGACLR